MRRGTGMAARRTPVLFGGGDEEGTDWRVVARGLGRLMRVAGRGPRNAETGPIRRGGARMMRESGTPGRSTPRREVANG
jgi:hypothetical protein